MCGGFKHPTQGWLISGRNGHHWMMKPNGKFKRWEKFEGDVLPGFGKFEGNARIEKVGPLDSAVVQTKGPWWRREITTIPVEAFREYSTLQGRSLTIQFSSPRDVVVVKGIDRFAIVTKPAPAEIRERLGVERVPVFRK